VTGPRLVGLVLAGGEGRRLGGPKALITDHAGRSWLVSAVEALRGADIGDVYVVVGAAAAAVRGAIPAGCRVVEAPDWQEGMGASLRHGLAAVAVERAEADAVVVMLVDTVGVGANVVRRVSALGAPDALVRAGFDGEPGHPVVIGRAHWAGVVAGAQGDQGARGYLRNHPARVVDCSDIGSGADIDTAAALADWRTAQD
jgi:CTP:molybdopterin cytidylyltransferase MocA